MTREAKEYTQVFIRLTESAKREYGPAQLAHLLSSVLCGNYSTVHRLGLAKQLLKGEELESGMKAEHYLPESALNQYPEVFIVEIVEAENMWTAWVRRAEADRALLDKAVSGDADAAFEFCKKLHSGEINWGAAMG